MAKYYILATMTLLFQSRWLEIDLSSRNLEVNVSVGLSSHLDVLTHSRTLCTVQVADLIILFGSKKCDNSRRAVCLK
jgi:hypothetical protein